MLKKILSKLRNPTILFGSILVGLLCAPNFGFAQQKITIARMSGEKTVIVTDTSVIHKAMRRTIGDGTGIFKSEIISQSGVHYLVGSGMKKNYTKMIAIPLLYDMVSRSYFIQTDGMHLTCASAACSQCKLFTENGKLVGCNCPEQQSVSNQCNFTRIESSPFYQHLLKLTTGNH